MSSWHIMCDQSSHFEKDLESLIQSDKPIVDWNAKTEAGRTVLIVSVENKIKEALFKKVCTLPSLNLNDRDNSGKSIVHWLMDEKNLKYLKSLANIPGVDWNIKDDENCSPLYRAAMMGLGTSC